MPICLTHNQSYAQDEYCVYCGAPIPMTVTTTTGLSPRNCRHTSIISDTAGIRCAVCGEHFPPIQRFTSSIDPTSTSTVWSPEVT